MASSDRDDGLREWSVAAGLLITDDQLLLVANERRDGSVDWSPPGGVIDPGEAPLEALSREVREETGLVVAGWSEVAYRVEVVAPHTGGFRLQVQVHQALSYTGEVTLDDPDGIVIDADFVPFGRVHEQMQSSPPWVAEPVTEWSSGDTEPQKLYRYRLMVNDGERQVLRLHDG